MRGLNLQYMIRKNKRYRSLFIQIELEAGKVEAHILTFYMQVSHKLTSPHLCATMLLKSRV